MRTKRRIVIVTSLIISVLVLASRADYRDDSKAVKVSGGEDHTLVLTANNWPWACGPNGGNHPGVGDYWGVLGIGSDDRYLGQKTLVRVGTDLNHLEDICEIAAGWKHSLALDVNGFVWSWGWNSQGQLGIGDSPYETTPVEVFRGEQAQDPCEPSDYLKHIIGISAGRSGEHSLAVGEPNGYVYAWGRNAEGQLGTGVSGSYETTPVEVNGVNDVGRLEGIISVSAGERHSMALEGYDPGDPNLNLKGRVYTWGDDDFVLNNGSGVLGIGYVAAGLSATPVIVLSGEQDPSEEATPLERIVAISAGWDHSMALEKYEEYDSYLDLTDPCYTWPDPNHRGRVYTWGNNGQGWGDDGDTNKSNGGRLGNGSTTDGNSTPVLVLRGDQPPDEPNDTYPYLSHIIAISAGEAHSMALDVNGYVYCWGDNQHGQLGNGCDDPCATPVRVVGEDGVGYLENIVAISAGYWHSLAIDANGVIWTWGKGSAGRLGLGNTIDCDTPHRIPMVYNVTQETLHFTIQSAIDDANNAGDILEASPGTYFEDVNFLTKTITLRSADPNNPAVVEDTVIQGSGDDYTPAVEFTNNSNSTLCGFTIANEDYGVKCDSSSPTISNSVIANCGRHGLYCLNNSAVEVKNCTISGNGADYSQDGVNCSGSEIVLTNCLITGNAANGIYCNQSTAGITNCTIEDNQYMGVYAEQTTLEIMTSIFSKNADYGIEATGGCDIAIERSLIEGNGKSGLYAHDGCDFLLKGSVVRDNGWDGVDLEYNSSSTLTNNWIHNNGTIHDTFRSGIWFLGDYVPAPIVRNNTICGNPTYGIEVGETSYIDPDILNCIIYGNPGGDLHRDAGTFATVNYCCLQVSHSGTDNITSDPCFVHADANDFHLAAGSPCIDAGDPDFEAEPNETDIDGGPRVINEQVDIGADEFWATDFSRDGLVNFVDYAMLAAAWHTEPNDANYNDDFDLEDDDYIDFGDVLVLCQDWLSNAELWTGPMPLMAGRTGEGMVEALSLQVAPYELTAVEEKLLIAEPVDVKKLLDWLAEIWLDPEVREHIDAEAWLRLYQSLSE